MDKRAFALVLVSLIALFASFAYSYFYPTPTIFAEIPFPLTIISYFISGILFFGYLAFVPSILLGLQLGAEKNVAIFLYIFPIMIATYAGTKLGFALKDDFDKKTNFLNISKKIVLLVIIALALALAIELSLPTIIEYWPKNFLGLNPIQGKNAVTLIEEMSKLIMK